MIDTNVLLYIEHMKLSKINTLKSLKHTSHQYRMYKQKNCIGNKLDNKKNKFSKFYWIPHIQQNIFGNLNHCLGTVDN